MTLYWKAATKRGKQSSSHFEHLMKRIELNFNGKLSYVGIPTADVESLFEPPRFNQNACFANFWSSDYSALEDGELGVIAVLTTSMGSLFNSESVELWYNVANTARNFATFCNTMLGDYGVCITPVLFYDVRDSMCTCGKTEDCTTCEIFNPEYGSAFLGFPENISPVAKKAVRAVHGFVIDYTPETHAQALYIAQCCVRFWNSEFGFKEWFGEDSPFFDRVMSDVDMEELFMYLVTTTEYFDHLPMDHVSSLFYINGNMKPHQTCQG